MKALQLKADATLDDAISWISEMSTSNNYVIIWVAARPGMRIRTFGLDPQGSYGNDRCPRVDGQLVTPLSLTTVTDVGVNT
ncbi:hypothetical protein J6590_094844 [Homalodisca vitripennis]|nr:hypothetical protein J6590_022356 [Homalodisca vitripennis]KAG8245994.1 hypothetical protein J6590_094844 [Homalodisca vitripennis]